MNKISEFCKKNGHWFAFATWLTTPFLATIAKEDYPKLSTISMLAWCGSTIAAFSDAKKAVKEQNKKDIKVEKVEINPDVMDFLFQLYEDYTEMENDDE